MLIRKQEWGYLSKQATKNLGGWRSHQGGKWMGCKWPQDGLTQCQDHAHSILCIERKRVYKGVPVWECKKVWDKLQVTHERTNTVKETKVGILIHEYEVFSMQPRESIFEMYNSCSTIITNLKGLGKTYAKQGIGEEDSQ